MSADDMNIKIQNTSQSGEGNKGSCAALATYLEHEDQERIYEGKDPMPFLTPDGIQVTLGEVISKIDHNHSHLGKKDDKFYHIAISPSQEEIEAMGSNEGEQYESGIRLMKAISDSYAENFNRDTIETADDLILFWKFHFTRGNNEDLQFHMHGIVSRKSKNKDGKSLKLSPLTTHRATTDGPVKGGFDRTAFFEKCEKIFDQLFQYDRKVSETFTYRNVMAHGTADEKAEETNRLTEENKSKLFDKIAKGINKRREGIKVKNEATELANLLSQDNVSFPSNPIVSLTDAVKLVNLTKTLSKIIDSSNEMSSLELNLLVNGITCSPVIDTNGGVRDILIIKGGRKLYAKDLLDTSLHEAILNKYSKLTGIPTITQLQQRIEKEREKKASIDISKEISQERQRQTIKRRR